MTPEQFIDTCILAGFDYSVTFPPLNDGLFVFKSMLFNGCIKLDVPLVLTTRCSFLFIEAYETIKAHASGLIAVQSQVTAGHPGVLKTNYLDTFLKARALIRNHIVFDYSCSCEPLNKDPAQCPA